MRKLTVAVVLIMLLSIIGFAAPNVKASDSPVYWAKSYGGSHSDEAYAVAIAPNGDIIVAGRTYSFGAGWYDVWVFRLDANGNVKWQKTYGGEYWDEAYAVAIAPNGDIIVAGETGSFGADWKKDVWILRLDENGNVKWQKTYGEGEAYAVAIAPNGDIIVTGSFTMRLDANGNVIWAKNVGGDAVAIAPNGDIIVAGETDSFGAGKDDVWVLRLDENGNVKWQKTYGGSDYDGWGVDVAIAPNGDIIVAGSTNSFGAGIFDAWVLRLDENGNVKWQKTYGGSDIDHAYAVAIAENGDIIVTGSYLLRLSPDGELKWAVELGDGYGYDIKILRDGTAVLAGEYNDDFLVARFNVDEVPNYSGWDGWDNVNLEVGDSYAQVESTNAQVEESNAEIHDTNAEIQNTNAEVETLWTTMSTLKISSIPSGAKVYVNGSYKGETPLTLELLPGTYTVKLTKEDYEDYTKTVEINPGETTTLSATLTPKFGYLTVYSSPSGAEVYVDGDYVGTTPLENYKLSTGKHSVVVKKNDYQDYKTTVTIEPGKTKKLEVTLSKAPGTLKIASEPSGAKVYIGGDYKGKTPLTLNLAPGTYTVKLTMKDYEDYTTTVTLSPGDVKSLSITLTPKFGSLTVTSEPSGAEVYLDGDYVGTTPLENYKLSTGEHEVKVKKSGYATFTKTITIKPGETTSMKATLPPLKATLKITSEPSGAKVYVNGTYKGVTPLTLNLTPGTYTIKLSKEDHEDYTTTVTLSAEETKTISATLEPAYGFLSVDSTPSDAEIYVDGSYVGTTPLEDYKLSPGEHEVKIKKDGYKEYTKTVTITAGEKKTLSTSLVPLPPPTTGSTTTTTTTTTTSSTTTTPPASSSETPSPAQTSSLPYIAGALIGLLLIGGVAAKAKGGKPKPSPSPEASPTPEKTGIKTQSKHVPGFPPELLSKYEPLEFLGEGGFAKVFKVKRKSDGRIIALKVSRLDEKAKKFFLKEVKAWRLLDHPNIVKLYNAFDEPLPHLEIEFVDGIKLNGEVIRDLGKYPKPVDEEKALHFVRGIAEGLKHAHGKQVYHRDLKPQNVLITSDLTPKITDWGLAKVGAVSTTATTTKGLTLLYAAPEQLDDETYGHTDNRTDIYQLGLIFYELLTGKLPYQGTSPAVIMGKVINPAVKPKPPSHFNKSLAKYDGIFEKLLAKRKEQRYQSIEEFLKDLELMKKLDEERKALEKEIEKTKTTMSMTTDSKELKKLMRQLVEQLSRNALLHAQLNDKAGLINALEDLKAFSKKHRKEIENAISQFELMMRESIPISKSTLDELRVLLHKVQREVE